MSVEKFSKKNKSSEFSSKGLIVGLGIIKGVTSKSEKDYNFIILNNQESSLLREHFIKNSAEPLTQFKPNEKSLIFVRSSTNENAYEVYYILNQKIVRRPGYYSETVIPTVILEKESIDNLEQNKQALLEKALKILNLDQPIYTNNKSASQNNFSVIYDF